MFQCLYGLCSALQSGFLKPRIFLTSYLNSVASITYVDISSSVVSPERRHISQKFPKS